MSNLLKAVIIFLVFVLLLGGITFLVLHFRNELPIPAIRTDMVKGEIQSNDATHTVSNKVKEIADTYKFDQNSKTGVTIIESETDTVLVSGILDSYQDFIEEGQDGSVSVKTTAGVITVLLDVKTVYSSINDSDNDLGSIKELKSMREMEKGNRIRVKAVLRPTGKFYAEYVEERL